MRIGKKLNITCFFYLNDNLEADDETSWEWSDSSSDSDSSLLSSSLLSSSVLLPLLLVLWLLVKSLTLGSGNTKGFRREISAETGVERATSFMISRAPNGSPWVRVCRSGLQVGTVLTVGWEFWMIFATSSLGKWELDARSSWSTWLTSLFHVDWPDSWTISWGFTSIFSSFSFSFNTVDSDAVSCWLPISSFLRMLLRAHCSRSAKAVFAGLKWLSNGETNIPPKRRLADLNFTCGIPGTPTSNG